MKTWTVLIMMAVVLSGCEEVPKPEKKEESIVRNLPTNDRAFLLEPLEAALDDLREITDNDPALTEATSAIDTLGWKGEKTYRTEGADTMKLDIKIENSQKRERHLRYWDEDGELFYLEARINYLDDAGKPLDQRAFRIYFEEGQVMISGYGKTSFNGEPLPDTWRTVEPLPETLQYLLHVNRFL